MSNLWLRRLCQTVLLSALWASLLPSEARGFTRTGGIWRSLPVSYYWNPSSVPASLGGADNGRVAIETGFAIWASQPCTRVRAVNAGTSAQLRPSSRDRQNTIFWISGSWPPELGPASSVIGVTLPVSSGGGNIDADIAFNAVGFRWSTNGASGTVDATSIAVHEEGHFLGLGHTTSPRNSIMYPSYSGGAARVASSDDTLGICTLYPGTGTPVPDGGVPPPPPPPPPPPGDPCLAITSCAECTPQATCGWCASSRQCLTGNAVGPFATACTDWRPYPMNCSFVPPASDSGVPGVDPCNSFAACGSCTGVSNCGWCGAVNRCMYSTSRTGPVSGSCSSGWSFDSSSCGGDIGGTTMFGGGCRSSVDCSSGGPCISLPGGVPFCSQRCEDDCSCPRGYGCVATAAGFNVCVPGSNRCSEDSGAVPDVPVTPEDVIAVAPDAEPTTRLDAGRSSDVVTPGRDTDPATEPPLADLGGCGCRAAPRPSRSTATALLLGLLALARQRRRSHTSRHER